MAINRMVMTQRSEPIHPLLSSPAIQPSTKPLRLDFKPPFDFANNIFVFLLGQDGNDGEGCQFLLSFERKKMRSLLAKTLARMQSNGVTSIRKRKKEKGEGKTQLFLDAEINCETGNTYLYNISWDPVLVLYSVARTRFGSARSHRHFINKLFWQLPGNVSLTALLSWPFIIMYRRRHV